VESIRNLADPVNAKWPAVMLGRGISPEFARMGYGKALIVELDGAVAQMGNSPHHPVGGIPEYIQPGRLSPRPGANYPAARRRVVRGAAASWRSSWSPAP